jgi:hypothetical protein
LFDRHGLRVGKNHDQKIKKSDFLDFWIFWIFGFFGFFGFFAQNVILKASLQLHL